MICKELWIGLANIIPKEGNNEFSDVKGAYVNVIMHASNNDNFIDAVKLEFDYRGFYVVDIEDIELFSERKSQYQLRDELLELANYVEQTGMVGIDRFHLYENDDDSN